MRTERTSALQKCLLNDGKADIWKGSHVRYLYRQSGLCKINKIMKILCNLEMMIVL